MDHHTYNNHSRYNSVPTTGIAVTTLMSSSSTNTTGATVYGFSGKTMHFRSELQRLESLLHFPEEVAHRLTEIEHEIFYAIEPLHYIRQGKLLILSKHLSLRHLKTFFTRPRERHFIVF